RPATTAHLGFGARTENGPEGSRARQGAFHRRGDGSELRGALPGDPHMTLRRIDSRFLLPHPVRRAVVLPGIDGWEEELERANVDVWPDGSEPLDLVVGPAERAGAAVALRPRAVTAEGRGGPGLAWAGFRWCAYLRLPIHFG